MEQPIKKSLVHRKTVAGIPRGLCGLLWGSAMAVGLLGHVWWYFVVAGAVHGVLAWIMSKDPLFFVGISRQLHMPMRRWRV